MSTVLDQAQNFSGGPVAAARKREGWLRKAANATDPEKREQYREAAADLAARYPDIEDLEIGEAEKFARERGHGSGARSPVHDGRSRPRPSTPGKRATSKPAAIAPSKTPRRRPSKTSARGGVRRASSTPRVDRAVAQTGVPAAASSGGELVLSFIGGSIGLGLLYALLTGSERNHAFKNVVGAVTKGVETFMAPRDFFPSNNPAPRSQGATGTTGGAFGPFAGLGARLKAQAQHHPKPKAKR